MAKQTINCEVTELQMNDIVRSISDYMYNTDLEDLSYQEIVDGVRVYVDFSVGFGKVQEALFVNRIDQVVKFFKKELTDISYEETSLDTIVYDELPNMGVYIDYWVSNINYRIIHINNVDILNIDDCHISEAERILKSAIDKIVFDLNNESENEYLDTISY